MADASGAEAGRELGTGELVLAIDTVPFALWAAFAQPRDFAAAISLAPGGLSGPESDKDTVCAIVGELAALSAEPSTIPADWLEYADAVPS